ncbi:Amino acid/polyamine transporter I [Penicillium soppii]|uniref:Amino acid/polyamine transporter I n=1 Tax=Penicillium soppii TaxID=69789 RepID=UPI0025472E1B|nr:Amino acid/polyamine transporter I [Penicillium soppii]KAJ5864238.1 Amino acid/polyamine transporter I [Penicillium soppii]
MSDITAILASGSQLNTTVIKVQNEDELRWVGIFGRLFGIKVDGEQGHKQELKRHFSIWSLIGLAANCTNSWTGQ